MISNSNSYKFCLSNKRAEVCEILFCPVCDGYGMCPIFVYNSITKKYVPTSFGISRCVHCNGTGVDKEKDWLNQVLKRIEYPIISKY